MTYTPSFRCSFCGQSKSADLFEEGGRFIPCQCPQAIADATQKNHEEVERRKQAAAAQRKRGKR